MDAANIISELKNRQPSILGHENYREFSILLPLVEANNETHILFEVRSMNLRSQPGDICFPGGKVDFDDRTTRYTAIRETSEELGIPEANVVDTIPLDYIVSNFGRIIYPYIGRLNHPENILPNPDEVAEVFTVPLSYFLETKPKSYKVNYEAIPEDNFPYELINGGESYNWATPHIYENFYQYKDKVIWGLTAQILIHFITLLKKDN